MHLFDYQKVLAFLRRPLEVVFLRYILGFMILAPTIMFLLWLATPKRTMDVLIINKSVPDLHRTEHAALSWMLKNQRIVNSEGRFYLREADYLGFHPRLGHDFVIKDFGQSDSLSRDSLVQATDIVYFADAYGVYSHNYGGALDQPNRSLYGGVNPSDLAFLKQASDQNKMIITEFSLFGHPTSRSMKDSLETLFGLKWSGWIGRYFISLDTTANDALPPWVVNLYQQSHGSVWPFVDSGIVLVRDEEIVILEYGTHLDQETPFIETQEIYAAEYDLPELVRYPFWFDIVTSPNRENRVVSIFHLPVNLSGQKLLDVHKIPRIFPAVLNHSGDTHPFYYFAGDFSDNPVRDAAAYFRGIDIFQSFFYSQDKMDDRSLFFWRYYKPLITSILDQEYLKKQK